jgi:adenylate cyclase
MSAVESASATSGSVLTINSIRHHFASKGVRPMQDLARLRRAGGDALRALVTLLPPDWDPRSGDEDVTLVFADIEGYSTYVADAGDDAALAVLDDLDTALEAALADHRARVVKRLGDGMMIVSRQPADALLVAVDLVGAFAERMAVAGLPLRLRAGVHRGTTRRQGDDYFGYHVNLAARVAQAARGGEALATRHALAGVDVEALGLYTAPAGRLRGKGVADAVELFAVSAEPVKPAGGVPFLRRLAGR